MRFDALDGHTVELIDEPMFTPGSADNARAYQAVRRLGGGREYPTSTHGVIVADSAGREVASCVLLASGGSTGVHPRSVVVTGDVCHVAVGDHVVAVRVPTLELLWATRADQGTCFGLHRLPDGGLIVHGELSISRLSPGGELVWQAGGADIFTGSVAVNGGAVWVEDFNGRAYRFSVVDGHEMPS